MTGLLPTAPAEAAVVFGDRLELARAYVGLLAGPAVERGLLGPRETDRLWERHLLNCAGLADLVAPGQALLDVGSGAGLPGVVLALLLPGTPIGLVEPMQRRAAFLAEVVAELGLHDVVVHRARAEELAGKVDADVVVARAVAPLDRLAGWCLPLLRPDGRLLALKGERAEAELALARPALGRLRVSDAAVVAVGSEERGTSARVVVLTRSGEAARPAPAARSPRPGRPDRPPVAARGRR